MKPSLARGLAGRCRYRVSMRETVPRLFDDSADMAAMPQVLATAYLVALMERACIETMAAHLDAGEISLGTAIDLAHLAPNVVGDDLMIAVSCDNVEKRQSSWTIEATTAGLVVGRATHRRTVVDAARFVGALPAPRPA